MTNSTKTKPAEKSEEQVKLSAYLADIQEKLSYLMTTLVDHAAEIKEQRLVIDKIRNRMGI